MQLHPLNMRLPRRGRPIAWHRWERSYLAALTRREAALALLSGGGGDDWYYSMWDNPDAHQQLLEDQVRYAAYQDALMAAAPLLEGRTVLDVGCGAGLLSLMAAEAGAAHVYAVDASQGAADLAARVVRANKMEGRITVIHGRAEAVALPVESVDVIVCDWMGNALLHDSLLPALAAARDRWLAPGGLMFPDAASLHVMGVDDRQYVADKKAFWHTRQLGDFDMSPVLNAVVRYPRQDTLARRSQAVTGSHTLLTLDLYKAGPQDLTFSRPFRLTAQREGRVSALLAYFDVVFTSRGAAGAEPPALTTHPMAPATGWLQTIFSFPRALQMDKGAELSGAFSCRPAGRPPGRSLDVGVDILFQGAAAKVAYAMRRPQQRG
ncbi:MAG: S-adenosyl-L-methionine-dependent methyltransferase [Monoraphidium minutum]|nr:MAG: S-adenosyl-L-methionine-dependent methyltransferase [Monoraphidium minutum]